MDYFKELSQNHPFDAWLEDFDYWASQGPLPQSAVAAMLAYFAEKYAGNPRHDAMAGLFWNSLQFLEAMMPQLVAAGLVQKEADGALVIPNGFQSAFYRATFSFPEVVWPHRIDIPLLVQLTKDQKDWNEDRS